MNLAGDALFEAIKKLRGERFNLAWPVFTPIVGRLSFTKIGDRLRAKRFRRFDGSEIEDKAVIAIYRAKGAEGLARPHAQGMGPSAIGKALGCHRMSVYRLLEEAGEG
jgi:hypothetical protein